MAYDRNDRDERSRWSDEDRRSRGEHRGQREERGFFERAGDEIASWFGDDRDDEGSQRGDWRDQDRERSSREWRENRGPFARGGSSERDYNPRWREELSARGEPARDAGRSHGREGSRGYRPVTGDYGRGGHESEQFFAASGVGRGEPGFGQGRDRGHDRPQSPWDRDEYRRTSLAGSRRDERDSDPHYRSWRERQVSELDRDYDDYRREHQSKFESDFTSWREKRQQKRGLLGQIREQMEVVGSDDQPVGTVERVAGDRIVLAKSDPDSGGVGHSLSCSDIDRVEGDRVVLDCSAEQARGRWRDESRGRALFEREDQGEMGPRMLDRSFEGTYR